MLKKLVEKGRALFVALVSLLIAPIAAMAQTGPTFDTSGITATITAVGAAAAIVGAAYVAMRIGVRAWKWLTGAA